MARIPFLPRTLHRRTWDRRADVIVFASVIALFYAVLTVARLSLAPMSTQVTISQRPSALPLYAAYSLYRIGVAYLVSLVFSLCYGYVAAHSRKAERFMVPLLDILQSIPVLCFLPPVMLAMVALAPARQIGLEMGCILLIFTGQAWNMTFSFYSSLKSIPRELREATNVYRFSAWQRFAQLELPFAAIGLVWNSMMSVAGGWFFLMACETFVLNHRDFRLPGLGSYLSAAAQADDKRAILWGLGVMIGVIVMLDQLVWRPVIAWSEKFKFEQVESSSTPRSPMLYLLRQSRILAFIETRFIAPASERMSAATARKPAGEAVWHPSRAAVWGMRLMVVVAAGFGLYMLFRVGVVMSAMSKADLKELGIGTAATFLRVVAALVIGVLWTLPVGVAIGSSPKLARIAQPLTQIAASVPATALFPVILLVLVRIGGGLGIGSLVLMVLGTQWYILFNVIAGAMALPTDLKEAALVCRFGRMERWRLLILPGVFPYLVTGLVTASGGAWNASVVAEYFNFAGKTMTTVGLGAIISQATDSGNFDRLLAATIVMSMSVVVINRTVWHRLYRLAETRFKLES